MKKLIIKWEDFGMDQQDVEILRKEDLDTKEAISVIEFVIEQLKNEQSSLCNI